MKLVRAFAEAWREFSPDDMNDVAKSGWLSVASFLYTLFRNDAHTFADGEKGLTIGDAYRPEATGQASIKLPEGMALIHDPALSDDYLGEVIPCWLEEVREVTIPINTASSQRIVSVFITYQQLESDERQRWFRDPEEEQTYREQTPHTIEWDAKVRVVEGTPGSGSAPSAPSDGGPWLRICDIDRPVNQTAVKSGEITDQRNRDLAHLSQLVISAGAKLTRGAGLTLEEGAYLATFFPNEGDSQLELYDDTGSGLSFGHLWLGTLEAIERLEAPVLRALGGSNADLLDLEDANGNQGAGKLRLSELWAQAGQILLRNQDDSGWGDLKAGVVEAADYFIGTQIRGTGGANNNILNLLDANGNFAVLDALATKVSKLRGRLGSGSDEVHVRNIDDTSWGLLHARNIPVAHGVFKWDSSAGSWSIVQAVNLTSPSKSATGRMTIQFTESLAVEDHVVHADIGTGNLSRVFRVDGRLQDNGSTESEVVVDLLELTSSSGDLSQNTTDPPNDRRLHVSVYFDRA